MTKRFTLLKIYHDNADVVAEADDVWELRDQAMRLDDQYNDWSVDELLPNGKYRQVYGPNIYWPKERRPGIDP